ncbi:tyrosine-type recombinase/integrase [Sneathiella sp.]|uniref:tyrosine-type recombinase/integrase n=1 Tax=Sneathiella sp. TaxID=1964365 RepID=UPI0025D0802F|nr:site-specific integrase [Sneathiella sp.]
MPELPTQKTRLDKVAALNGRQTDYKDNGPYRVPGLALRVSPSGNRSWIVTARRPGKKNPSRFTLGDYRELSLTDARDRALKFKAQLREGGDPVLEKRKRREAAAQVASAEIVTLRSVSDRFLAHCRKKNRTADQQDRTMKIDVLPVLGDLPLDGIKRSDIISLIETKAETSPVMANRILSLVRRFFNWAISVDLLGDNPAAGVKPPHAEKTRDRVLTDDEIKKVCIAAENMGKPFGPITLLLILTAQRRNEVVSMRWSEIDQDNKVWIIPADRAKNGVENRVPLSEAALEIINSQSKIDKSDFIFPSSRSPEENPASGLSKAKRNLDDASGVNNWRYHDLRRTAASGMARLGIAPHVVEKILNHVSGSFGGVAGIYNRFGYEDEKRHALDSWAAALDRIVRGQRDDNIVAIRGPK